MINNYFTKKDLNNVSEWSQAQIADFLIWDNINALKSFGLKDIEKRYFRGMQSAADRYEKYKFILDLKDKFFSFFLNKSKKNKKTILFEDNRYPLITSEVKKYYNLKFIVSGKKERLFVAKNFYGYLSINNLYRPIYEYWSKNDFNYLKELLENLEKKIKDVNPDYIVLYGDDKPVGRAIIFVAKKLGIPIINIQSVLLIEKFPLFFGALTDYIFVWGEYFKKLFISHTQSKRNPEDIYILGYSAVIKKNRQKIDRKISTVCYLGENYEFYNDDLLDVKIKTIESLNKICEKLNLKFIYRPHPGDDKKLLKKKLPNINFTSENEKLTDTFEKGDIFISFDSSTLAEATVYDKICLQLINYPIKTDNLEKGGARIKSFETIAELEKYLQNLIKSQSMVKDFMSQNNDFFIETLESPGKKFIELLNKVKK